MITPTPKITKPEPTKVEVKKAVPEPPKEMSPAKIPIVVPAEK